MDWLIDLLSHKLPEWVDATLWPIMKGTFQVAIIMLLGAFVFCVVVSLVMLPSEIYMKYRKIRRFKELPRWLRTPTRAAIIIATIATFILALVVIWLQFGWVPVIIVCVIVVIIVFYYIVDP